MNSNSGNANPAHRSTIGRRTPFEQVVLVLQGGGALGSYQAGVYQALAAADLHPDWVAGISIGAFNSALIAGNPPEKRVERLREFWETISSPPLGIPFFRRLTKNDLSHQAVNQMWAWNILMFGRPKFFVPRPPPTVFFPGDVNRASFYDNSAISETLAKLIDFDRLNGGDMRFSVGTVDVESGNFVYFDSSTHRIGVEHIVASGALPPAFPATEVNGRFYWDGGLVSNTPLEWVLDSRPRRDTLAFQVDLWPARGRLPKDLIDVEVRHKEIVYSSRTRAATDRYKTIQKARNALSVLLAKLPPELRDDEEVKILQGHADDKVCSIAHLIYRSKIYESFSKDYEFSRRTMEEHWDAGYADAYATLQDPEVLQLPDRLEGVRTFDCGVEHAAERRATNAKP
jgi:NTE family protein